MDHAKRSAASIDRGSVHAGRELVQKVVWPASVASRSASWGVSAQGSRMPVTRPHEPSTVAVRVMNSGRSPVSMRTARPSSQITAVSLAGTERGRRTRHRSAGDPWGESVLFPLPKGLTVDAVEDVDEHRLSQDRIRTIFGP